MYPEYPNRPNCPDRFDVVITNATIYPLTAQELYEILRDIGIWATIIDGEYYSKPEHIKLRGKSPATGTSNNTTINQNRNDVNQAISSIADPGKVESFFSEWGKKLRKAISGQ